jgi:hypothetical protein
MEIFGWMGFVFGIIGIIAYSRVDKLEKHLKKTGVLDKDFTSEETL